MNIELPHLSWSDWKVIIFLAAAALIYGFLAWPKKSKRYDDGVTATLIPPTPKRIASDAKAIPVLASEK